jgi:hypothetical protein
MRKTTKLPALRTLAALLLPLVSLAILAGCETYGSKCVPVTLTTQPKKISATAFLVPIEHWNAITQGKTYQQPYTPPNPDQFREQLEPYRVQSKRTPVTTDALPYQTIYLVESSKKYWWMTIKPGTHKMFSIAVE